MTDVALLGIQVDSTGAAKAVSDLDKLTGAAGKAETATSNLAVASGRVQAPLAAVARGSVLAGNGARMMAQQLSQVGQMTLVTGNFVQALAIQLPDLGLAFGAAGAAAGLLASIALPALISAFSGTSTSMADVQKSLDASAEAVDRFVGAAQAARAPIADLTEQYGSLSREAREALAAMADVRQVEAINAISAAIAGLNDALLKTDIVGQQNGRALSGQVLADSFGMAANEATRFRDAILDLGRASGVRDQALAAQQAQRALIDAFGSVQKMPPALRSAYAALAGVTIEAGKTQGELDKSLSLTKSLGAAAANLRGFFGAAAGAVDGLTGALRAAVDKAYEFQQLQRDLSANRRTLPGQRGDPRTSSQAGYGEFIYTGPALDAYNNPIAPSGVGSGASDGFADRLAQLQEDLQGERAVIDAWYADAMAVLADRRSQELLGLQGHKDALIQVERLYQDQLAALESTAQQQRLSDTANFFGALSGIAQAGGKGMVKAVAAFQAVEGTINAYGAAVKALNTPGLSLWGRFAAYASVLAAGLKGVAAIRAAGGIGGSGGGSGASSVPAAQGVQSQPQNTQTLIVQGIRASDLFTGQMIYDMFMGEGRLRNAPIVQLMR